MPLRPVLYHTAKLVAVFLVQRPCLKVKCAKGHKITALFSCSALSFFDKSGAQALPAVLFIHPQYVQVGDFPCVYCQYASGDYPAVAVCDLEIQRFLLCSRNGQYHGVIVFADLAFYKVFVTLFQGLQFVLYSVNKHCFPPQIAAFRLQAAGKRLYVVYINPSHYTSI